MLNPVHTGLLGAYLAVRAASPPTLNLAITSRCPGIPLRQALEPLQLPERCRGKSWHRKGHYGHPSHHTCAPYVDNEVESLVRT